MASSDFQKFLGKYTSFENGPYLSDGKLAAHSFLQSGTFLETNQPLLAFQYYVRFRFNSVLKSYVSGFLMSTDESMLIPLVHQIDLPKIDIDTSRNIQYNKQRLHHTRLKFNPVTFTVRDVADGKTQRMWEMYYKYYFKDGDKNNGRERDDKEFGYDIVSGMVNTDFGYNLGLVSNEKYLIDAIEVYQVHAGHYKKTELIHPMISKYDPGRLDFSKSDAIDIRFTVEFEDVIYHNEYAVMESEDFQVFANSGFRELSVPTSPRILPSIPKHRRNADGSINASFAELIGQQDEPSFMDGLVDKLSSIPIVGDAIGGVVGTVQRNVSSYVDSLPDSIARAASSYIFTGEVEFPVDIKAAGKSILDNAIRQSRGNARTAFTSAVRDIGEAVTDSISDSFTANGTSTTPPTVKNLGPIQTDANGVQYRVDYGDIPVYDESVIGKVRTVNPDGTMSEFFIDNDRTATSTKSTGNFAPVVDLRPI